MRSIILRPTTIILFFILFPLTGAAQIYKWTDQHGEVQYGDRPPLDKKNSELGMRVPEGAGAYASSNWEERDREFRKRRIEKQAQADKDAPVVSGHKICLNAQYKLQLLDGKSVYKLNDKGERVYMGDAERNVIETKAKQDIATYCTR